MHPPCFRAKPSASPGPSQIHVEYLKPGILEERLRLAVPDQRERRVRLTKLFEESGCTGDFFREQKVSASKDPNLICRIPAENAIGTIVVGAHYDSAGGDGIVDNWTGAVLLPSLFEIIRKSPRRHNFEFVGFAAEERGLIGSAYYVRTLSKEDRKLIRAVVTIDSLGLTPTKVWVSHSDPKLTGICAMIAKAMKLDLKGVNADQVGSTDSYTFKRARIPVLSLHSVTQETLDLINSKRDVWASLSWNDYYDSYRLITAVLMYLDESGAMSPDTATASK